MLALGVVALALRTSALAMDTTMPIPVPGMVTLVELGAKQCIPCKMQAPVLEALKREYAGRAAIVSIDVEIHPDETDKFDLRTIPTLIFYDAQGKERWRHMGFLKQAVIESKLKELGVR